MSLHQLLIWKIIQKALKLGDSVQRHTSFDWLQGRKLLAGAGLLP